MRLIVATLVLAAALVAQGPPSFMQTGSVIHGYGGGTVALMDIALQTSTPIQIVPGTLGCNAFIWDPWSPDDIIAWGTDGHIHRATVSSGGVSTTQWTQTPLAGLSGVVQMSWDANGDLITVGVTQNHQIFRVARATGVVTPLLAYPFPTSPRCGRVDPATGDYYVGTNSAIFHVAGVQTGTPSVNQIYTSSGAIDDMAFDPLKPQYLLFVEQGRIRRIDKNTGVMELLYAPAPFFDHIRVDEAGTFIAVDGRNVYRVDNPATIPSGGITPVLIGTNAAIGCCTNTDVAVVGSTATPFRLEITPQAIGGAQIDVLNTPVGVTESWMFLSKTTFLPAGGGPFLGIVPDGFTFFIISSYAVPQPNNLVHASGPPPPSVTLPGGFLAPFVGETWDAVLAVLGPGGAYWGRTNVVRVTWL